MTENKYVNLLFQHLDMELENTSRNLRNRIFSHYRDIDWTSEQQGFYSPLFVRNWPD